jgi:uncharacterized RDD family membrane protein YckC
MSETEPLEEKSVKGHEELAAASFLNRLIARTIDLIIVVALHEIIPSIGYFTGLVYLLIADGLFGGRSVGKKLIGLKVVLKDDSGTVQVCGFKESIFRNFPFAIAYILCGMVGAIPLLGWLLSFGIVLVVLSFESLVIIGSSDGTRLGDEVAKTQVVEDRQGGVDDS